MKVMVAFLGKKRNKRNDYINQIKKIHKNNIVAGRISSKQKTNFNIKNNDKKDKNKFKLQNKYYNLNNYINKNEDENFFSSLKLTLIFCILLIFVVYKYPRIQIYLSNFATNFRQADKINVGIEEIVSTMSLFNKDNYIVAENIENVESKDNIVVQDINEYKIIDKEIEKYDLKQVFSNNAINVNINSETATLQKVSVNDISILNYSSNRSIDFKEVMSKDINLTKKSDKILLYNTHTSESYTNSENYKFEYSSTMRSLDAKYNMLSISKELNENLLKKGFLSIQETTPHDYGAYTGAYTKSRTTVTNAIQSMGGAGIIIDVHRDAMADLSYRPIANVNGVQVSQLMFVVGIGTGENKYWEENLRLALKLQQIANKVYPGLFRQMIIRDSTYNQDLNKYSLLIEFGATGNTIDEVKLSTRCVANLLNILYKD